MQASTLLVIISALIPFLLGTAHLVFTFHGPKLLPRDPRLIESMKPVSMVITKETTVWKAWVGFNASHSMAAMLFGLLYGYFALVQPELLFGSVFLQLVGFLMLAGFVVLARLYWFSVPLAGVSISLFCYLAGIVLAHG